MKKREIIFIDRLSGHKQREKLCCEFFLRFVSSNKLGTMLLNMLARLTFVSAIVGLFLKSKFSKNKIKNFVDRYKIDMREFVKSVDSFQSFNDFFIRKLKPGIRRIEPSEEVAITPADGRYFVFPSVENMIPVDIKEKRFSVEELIGCNSDKWKNASIVVARLCPTDYHRFHFPCKCVPKESKLINGLLQSVNPLALPVNIAKSFKTLCENKRVVTELETEMFGTVLFVEIGAMNVGTITQTFEANKTCEKGDEKGFFSMGGSCLVLVFQSKSIVFDADLVLNSKKGFETLCRFGQSLGKKIINN